MHFNTYALMRFNWTSEKLNYMKTTDQRINLMF